MEYKGYLINPDKTYPSLLKIAVKGQGGKIPNVLDSLFTSLGTAKSAIDGYLLTKEMKSGKTNSESGD